MNIKELNEVLESRLPLVKGIVDTRNNKTFVKGENPFMDMQIQNYLVCPDDVEDFFGFNKNEYKLIWN